MATALMISDDLHINRYNPYTWSGTYGVPTDGSKWKSDGTYTVEIDERQVVYADKNDDLKDFNPTHVFRSGPVFIDEVAAKPSPPWGLFPARKYEYDNGSVTYVRPDLHRRGNEWADQPPRAKTWDLLVVVAILLLLFILYRRFKS